MVYFYVGALILCILSLIWTVILGFNQKNETGRFSDSKMKFALLASIYLVVFAIASIAVGIYLRMV